MRRAAAAILVLLCLACANTAWDREGSRPAHWAQPVELEGAPNLHRVDANLYRSGQPSAEGFARLAELGVKTVVNLRNSDSDRDKLAELDLDYARIPMQFYHLERSDLAEFLALATDSSRTPVLVHCKHGADRTGAAVASYRVLVEDWSREEAVAEMSHGGFGFHKVLWNMADWILKLDMDKLAAEAGLDARKPPRG